MFKVAILMTISMDISQFRVALFRWRGYFCRYFHGYFQMEIVIIKLLKKSHILSRADEQISTELHVRSNVPIVHNISKG